MSNVGPGPSDTNGTVTTDTSTTNTMIGARATTSVEIRLFTPPTVKLAARFADSMTREATGGPCWQYG
ncbi:hypothetical protein GCM10009856_08010 [Mycolicibacterium llatzerense]